MKGKISEEFEKLLKIMDSISHVYDVPLKKIVNYLKTKIFENPESVPQPSEEIKEPKTFKYKDQ